MRHGINAASVAAALVFLTLFTGCMHLGPKSPFASPKVTNPAQFEREMWERVKAGDWLEVSNHMAETFVEVQPQGVRGRAEILEHLKRHTKLNSFEMTDVRTEINGADMVVAYTLVLHFDGQPDAAPVRVMTVWQSVSHGWVQIAQSMMPAQ